MKRKRILLIIVAIILALGTTSFVIYRLKSNRCEQSMVGTCLPKGQCVGPTDIIVDCKTGQPLNLPT